MELFKVYLKKEKWYSRKLEAETICHLCFPDYSFLFLTDVVISLPTERNYTRIYIFCQEYLSFFFLELTNG